MKRQKKRNFFSYNFSLKNHKEVIFGILFLILLINLSSAARVPTVGGDSDAWGTVLNEFLNTSLNDTGHLRDNAVSTNQITNGAIIDADISDATNLTLGQKITFAFGEIIDNLVDGIIGITGRLDVTGDILSNGNNLTNAYLYSTNGTYYLIANPFGFYNLTSFDINDYYLSSNPFSFYNSTNPSPTYNLTYNTWAYNQTTPAINAILGFSYYNLTSFNINNYYLSSNPFGFYNSTTIPLYATWANVINGTLFTTALWNTNYTTNNIDWLSTYNSTYNAYNSSGFIRDWNASGLIANWSSSSSGSGVPAGAISAFNLVTCPTGWVLADGSAGTPDLRGIFIRGSGTSGVLKYANASLGYFSATYGAYRNDSLQGHIHWGGQQLTWGAQSTSAVSQADAGDSGYRVAPLYKNNYNEPVGVNPASNGSYGTPRTGAETTPAYYATIYCVKTSEDTPVSNTIWGTSGFNAFVQNTSLNVGIGTTSPGSKLTVAGQISITGASRARVYKTTAQTIPNAAWTKINYTDETFDNLNEYDNVTNYRFTATEAGYYLVIANVIMNNAGWPLGAILELGIFRNGALISIFAENRFDVASTQAAFKPIGGSDIIYLAAGDYVEIWIYHSQGGAVDIPIDTVRNWFDIHRLS